MSPKSSSSQYVVAVIVALLSIAAYLITSSFPLAATSIESVTVSIRFVTYSFLLYGLYPYALPYHPINVNFFYKPMLSHLHYCSHILT